MCKMSHTDCFRALGVAPDASWEEVRQAYLDLVRVWHPDRFQSDPQLRDRAQQHLQTINDAYQALKNSQAFSAHQQEPPPQAPPPQAPPPVFVHPHPRRGLPRFLRNLQFGGPLKAAWLGLACLAPLYFGSLLVNVLRVPGLDSILQTDRPRPVILMPSRFISSLGDRFATAEALSTWARGGGGTDLWRPVPKIGEKPPERPVDAVSGAGTPDGVAPSGRQRHRNAAAASAMPVNGTELLWTRRSGAGELWVSNQTSQDALATLVQAHTAMPLRAIYIQAKNKVCMRNIAPGLYDLIAEVGENWDPNRIRFQTARHPLDRSGPFECIDVTSTQGTSGCKYDVVLRTR